MGSRFSVPLIQTHTQPSPYGSMNTIYAGSSGISSVHLVGSADAACSICRILSTNCITAVDVFRFTHDISHPSNAFTGANISFASGMPIFAWWNFPMTKRDF